MKKTLCLCTLLSALFLVGAEKEGRGALCLTFDDYAGANWLKADSLFKKYNARVTFFIVGKITPEKIETMKKHIDRRCIKSHPQIMQYKTARTIRLERERRATAMLAPFMPCGAKIPVIALFAGAFFEDAMIPGTAQPTVITNGMTDLPDRPTRLKIGSRTTATRDI